MQLALLQLPTAEYILDGPPAISWGFFKLSLLIFFKEERNVFYKLAGLAVAFFPHYSMTIS